MKNDVRVILKHTCSCFVVILFGEKMDNIEKYLIQLGNKLIWKNEVGPIQKTTCSDMAYHMENDVRVLLKNTYSHFVVI
jgi:hypothetical protein